MSAKNTFKYAQTIDGVVKSAAQLTAENRVFATNALKKLSILGGAVGAIDSGIQSYQDFNNGDYGLAAYEATKGAAYTIGTILLFTPFAPIGATILGVTGAIDFAGDIGLYLYGQN